MNLYSLGFFLVLSLAWIFSCVESAAGDEPLAAGQHGRSIEVDGRSRSYLVHVPPQYDSARPTPVVLLFHGAGTNAPMMVSLCGMNEKADQAGFIAVYPNGTGAGKLLLTWNSGGFSGPMAENRPDDVKFVASLLDDLAAVANVDPKRVYAAGMSNGGMMCYRLAAEMPDRIAAIAPVGGTMSVEPDNLPRPVSVIHFHGTADKLVPWEGANDRTEKFMAFESVDKTIQTWVKTDGCPPEPKITPPADKVDDGTTVSCQTYGPGRDGAEVILWTIDGGGHTWPGRKPPAPFLGKSTKDISANDLIWEFFQKHPMR